MMIKNDSERNVIMKKSVLATMMAIFMATTPVLGAEISQIPETNYQNIRIYSDGTKELKYLFVQTEKNNGKIEKNGRIQLQNTPAILTVNGSLAVQDDMRVVDGTTYIPLRTMAELLGGSVQWNAQDKSVIFHNGSQSLIFVVDSRICMWNGKEIAMAKPMISINATTYLPVRALADLTGYETRYYTENAEENIWSYPQIALSKYPKDLEKLSPEQAAKIAEEKWILGLAALEKYESKERSLECEEIYGIDFTQTPVENDRYYLFSGKNTEMNLMVDKYTGAVYKYHKNRTMRFDPAKDGAKVMLWPA